MFSLNFYYLLLFVILVISRFGLEGWNWILAASVPDLCILFTVFATGFVYDYANAVITQAFSWYSLLVSFDVLQYYSLLKNVFPPLLYIHSSTFAYAFV